ncbi:hypothetical protein D3C86_2036110 [compost metagenome]
MKQQAAVFGAERQRAGKQQVVFGAVPGFRVAEAGLLQANALADQPAAQAMPDHQQAFSEKVIRIQKL